MNAELPELYLFFFFSSPQDTAPWWCSAIPGSISLRIESQELVVLEELAESLDAPDDAGDKGDEGDDSGPLTPAAPTVGIFNVFFCNCPVAAVFEFTVTDFATVTTALFTATAVFVAVVVATAV